MKLTFFLLTVFVIAVLADQPPAGHRQHVKRNKGEKAKDNKSGEKKVENNAERNFERNGLAWGHMKWQGDMRGDDKTTNGEDGKRWAKHLEILQRMHDNWEKRVDTITDEKAYEQAVNHLNHLQDRINKLRDRMNH